MKNNSKNIFNLFLFFFITLGALGALVGQVQAQTDVAEIDGTGYPSLQAALNAAEAGQTVKVLKNIGYEGPTIEVPANNKPITLDLNGCVIDDNIFRIPTGAHLTLIDSVGSGRITGKRSIAADPIGPGLIYVPGGTFIMKSGRISEYAFYGVLVSGNGRFEMSGGLLKFEGGYFDDHCPGDGYKHNSGGVNLYKEGEGKPTFIMSGGAIESIFGSCWSQCVNLQAGSFDLSGGEVNAMQTNALGVNTYLGTSFVMSGGKITGSMKEGVFGEGTVSISGGEISSNLIGVDIANTVNISGGIITNNDQGVIIDRTVNFSGGRIEGNHVIGIDYRDGTLNLFDVPAEGYGSPVVTGNGSANEPQNVVLHNNTIHIARPLSPSTKVGVYSPTVLVFTDGLADNGKSWNFSSDNSAYGVDLNDEKEAILVEGAAAITANGVTTYYPSLQAALNAAQTGQTVRSLKTIDSTVDSFPVTAPTGIPVTLDLNGQTIDISDTGNALSISTGADLTLTDSGSGGMVRSTGSAAAIVVNGDFTMSGGSIINNSKNNAVEIKSGSAVMNGGTITGEKKGRHGVRIQGGTFELKNGTISDFQINGVSLSNSSEGSFTMSGGIVSGNSQGIWQYSGNGTISITGGEITRNGIGLGIDGSKPVSMSGGSIINNTIGIDFMRPGSNFSIYDAPAEGYGSPVVIGNGTDAFPWNVDTKDNLINVTGTLSESVKLGITMNHPGVFTAGLKDRGTAANFSSDNPAYGVGITTEEEAILGRHLTVRFDPYGGTGNMDPQPFIEGESKELKPNAFTRDHYHFSGWNTEADGSGTAYADKQSVTISDDLKLFAQWKADTYTLSFDPNGGEGDMADQIFTYGEAQALTPHNFKLKGHGFEGWNTKADGSGTAYDDGEAISISENTTLYARWKPNVHTITFLSNGGAGHMHAEDFPFGSTLSLTPNAFTRDHYRFSGWNTEADGSGTAYADRQSVTISDDLKLFAQWKADIYTLSFDPNGGKGDMADQIFTYGEAQALMPHAFTREGHGFEGWNTKADGSGTAYDDGESLSISENTTLYAQWKANVHTVTFIPNGGEGHMHAEDFPFGSTFRLTPNAFTRPGFDFLNWNTKADGSGTVYEDKAEVTITVDLTLYAQWREKRVKSLDDETIRLILDPEEFEYDGTEKTVSYRVFDAEIGEYLIEGIDYELDRDNSTVSASEPGTYTVTVTADNKMTEESSGAKAVSGKSYIGSCSAQWQIVRTQNGIQFFRIFTDADQLPNTGFSSRQAAEQPARLQGPVYGNLGLSLQIPALNVETELVSIPLTEGNWPVEWLGERAGVLEGSALPGEGYSLIAAHNTLNDTEYGPFALLSQLEEADRIFVRTGKNELRPFRVYANELIAPDDFALLQTIAERETGSLILITCENESPDGGYLSRRAVFAKPVL